MMLGNGKLIKLTNLVKEEILTYLIYLAFGFFYFSIIFGLVYAIFSFFPPSLNLEDIINNFLYYMKDIGKNFKDFATFVFVFVTLVFILTFPLRMIYELERIEKKICRKKVIKK